MNESIELTIAQKVMGYRVASKHGSPVLVNRKGKPVRRFRPLTEDEDLHKVLDKVYSDGKRFSVIFSPETVFTAFCDRKKAIGTTYAMASLYAINEAYS